ncbi:MAG: PEGA domain-containing protein [Planctomycetales bacterium]
MPTTLDSSPSRGWRWGFLALGLLLVTTSGCMHRRLTIRTNPPGAAVLVDGEEAGFTPTAIDYTYYGTRDITLIKDGYKTVTVQQKIPTPWYQIFPLEFVTDNLALTHIRDKRDVTYNLVPEELVPTDEVLDRANSLRSNALQSEAAVPQR